jgi:hypothetical protein
MRFGWNPVYRVLGPGTGAGWWGSGKLIALSAYRLVALNQLQSAGHRTAVTIVTVASFNVSVTSQLFSSRTLKVRLIGVPSGKSQ